VKNFDFGPNICHKGKGDGIDNRGGKKQVKTVGVGNKESGEGDVGSRAGKGKGGRQLLQQQKGNSRGNRGNNIKLLNHISNFWEIVLSGLGASMKTLSMMVILNGVGQLAATYP